MRVVEKKITFPYIQNYGKLNLIVPRTRDAIRTHKVKCDITSNE